MTYEEARKWLSQIEAKGSRLGLESIRVFLEELGNPQDSLRFIHIAGTNGKGSVMAFLEYTLEAAGYRTGRYVSPALFSYEEKFRFRTVSISRDEVASYTRVLKEAYERLEAAGKCLPTLFEVETALSFLFFRDRECDVVLLETGMGGSLDATNIVQNKILTIFSSISLDHMAFLGNTVAEIARTKAGIMRKGVPAVSSAQPLEAQKVLTEEAEKIGTTVKFVDPGEIRSVEYGLRRQTFSYRSHRNITISLAGAFQIENAALALEAVDVLRRGGGTAGNAAHSTGFDISGEAVREGFEKAQWHGRFEIMNEDPLVIMDGAHNPDAARALMETLDTCLGGRSLIYIFGVFSDKEYDKIIQITAPAAKWIYTVRTPDNPRAEDPKVLERKIAKINPCVTCAVDVAAALPLALQKAQKNDVIVIFGSLSFLWQVREWFDTAGRDPRCGGA